MILKFFTFFNIYFREKLEELLQGIKIKIAKDCRRESEIQKLKDINYFKKLIDS